MFEVFGPFARPSPSVFPIAFALWPLVGAALALIDARRARARSVVVCVVLALASLGALAWSANALQHLGLAARIGQLDLVLALGLDPLAALASFAAASASAIVILRTATARRIALVCASLSAVEFLVMADGVALLVLAAAALSLVTGILGYVHSAHFVADRVADAALVAAGALLFWTLGGSWVAGDYVPELEPRVVVASRAPNAHEIPDDDDDDDRPHAPAVRHGARSSLSLNGMPNAAVLVDGTWLRDARGGHLVMSPFADAPITAGPHTIRVHVGPGSDDYYLPRVNAPENDRVLLAVRGATTTFREMQDDLVTHDARGEAIGRDAIARRRFFGVSATSIVLALVAFAFAARARLFPFTPSADENARSIVAIGAIVALARFSLGDVAPHASWIAGAVAAAAIGSASRAFHTKSASALFAAEIAIAGAGAIASPAFGVMHACLIAVLFARNRAPLHGAAHVALLPTRVAIIAACAAGPAALLVVASWLASCALARHRAPTSRRAMLATCACAATAIASYFFVPRLLAPSFRSLADVATHIDGHVAAIAGLVAAVVFASAASRRGALDRFSKLAALASLGSVPAIPARDIALVAIAIAAALGELDAHLRGLVAAADRAIRFFATLVSIVERATFKPLARCPIPSERAARYALVAFAFFTLGLFAVPWLI